ncbi:MAG: hypothetical protein M0R22_08050 [Dehalococcoidia bacterium]|jgi:hypothetical protein|nr:hypothetical protein [Dehalococcoidia bacterium]
MGKHTTGRRHLAILPLLAAIVLVLPACATTDDSEGPSMPLVPPTETPETPPVSYYLPHDGAWRLSDDIPTGRVPSALGTVSIEGLGAFTFNPLDVRPLRPDDFATGHFSVFDVMAHLADEGWFSMEYHYDRLLDTHVIDQLDGRKDWWYRAHYAGGWAETNAMRMDLFPYKDGMSIQLATRPEEYLAELYNSFGAEVLRKSLSLGRVVIPEVRIGTVVHQNVPVSAHDVRADVLQPGVVTALDVLLSLGDQRRIDALKLTWYSNLGQATPVDSFYVEQIDDGDGVYDTEASPETGGWVYETGSLAFNGFQGNNIRVPADVRIIVSPEYMVWYWIGSPR